MSIICLFVAYSSVLSLLHKPVNVRVRSRTVNGNEFQIEGPERRSCAIHIAPIDCVELSDRDGSRTEMFTTSCRRHRCAVLGTTAPYRDEGT